MGFTCTCSDPSLALCFFSCENSCMKHRLHFSLNCEYLQPFNVHVITAKSALHVITAK